MEVAEYAYPESWDDGGMDWSNPDPGRADYAMALRQAVLERAAAAHVPVGRGVLDVSPWRTVSAKASAPNLIRPPRPRAARAGVRT